MVQLIFHQNRLFSQVKESIRSNLMSPQYPVIRELRSLLDCTPESPHTSSGTNASLIFPLFCIDKH